MRRVFATLILAACGGGAAAAPHSVVLSAPSASAPASSTEPGMCMATSTTPCPSTTGSAARPTPSAGPKLCGCALCEPVLSDDPCKVDSDCLPATQCHATACVAAAHAQPRSPALSCTQEYRCDAIDANRCACVRGRCALAPK